VTLASFDMKAYARRGAEVRAKELQAELETIYGAFPELREGRDERAAKAVVNHEEQYGRRRTADQDPAVAETRRKRTRRQMTAAERKAVSERMRKYWEGRRTETGAKKR
jgi:hypothetical protein